MQGWPLLQDGRERMLLPSGNARASNGDALRQLVLGGLGMARLAAFQVQQDIAAGRLRRCWRTPIPVTWKRCTRCSWGRAATRGCARFLISWWRASI